MRKVVSLAAMLLSASPALSAQDEVLGDLTCELAGPADGKVQTIALVRAELHESELPKVHLEKTPLGCGYGEALAATATSKDGSVEIALIPTVCASKEVCWYARIRSDTLFPATHELAYGVCSGAFGRAVLGSEKAKAPSIAVDGTKFWFLYFDCRPSRRLR